MTEQPPPPHASPAAQLRVLRIIWAALLIGQVMFLIVATTIAAAPEPQQADLMNLLFYLALGMLVLTVPIGYLFRRMVYSRGRQSDGTIAAGAYSSGNIIFLAMFEGVGMFAIVGALLNGGRGPHLLVAAAALAMQIVNFPTGRPLRGNQNSLQPMDRE